MEKSKLKSKVLYDSDIEDETENEIIENHTIDKPTPSLEQIAPSSQDTSKEITVKVSKDKPKHICSECKKEFARKWFLDRHISELRCEVIREKTKQRDIEIKAKEMKDKEKEERRIKREEKKRLKEAQGLRQQKEEIKIQKKKIATQQPIQTIQPIQQPKPIRPLVKISF